MTAQIGDSVFWEGELRALLVELPLPADHPRIERVRATGVWFDHWQRYSSTYAVEGDRLMLVEVSGCYELTPGPPVPATWVEGILPLAEGLLVDHAQWSNEATYAALIELDVVDGIVRRARRIIAKEPPVDMDDMAPYWFDTFRFRFRTRGLNASSASWEHLPGGATLFAHRASQPLLHGPPQPSDFHLRALRERVHRARSLEHLRPGQLARRAGFHPRKGGRFVEWERGERDLPEEQITALARALGLSDDEVERLRRQDESDFSAALEEWASEAVVPALIVADNEYQAPENARGDRSAVEEWARACMKLTWRPGTLWLDRKTPVHFDEFGEIVAGGPLRA